MELNDILKAGVKNSASDIHLKVGLPPILRVDGKLVPLKVPQPLRPEDVKAMCAQIFANEEQRDRFERNREVDCSYSVPGLGRFRVNVFLQRSTVGIAIRVIPIGVLSFEGLHLPKVIEKVAMETRGLILCTGTTGSGKSTTLATIVEYINHHRSCHIIMIEDPIEFLLRDRKSIINQREIGADTSTFAGALKSALRQDPDVILVGEMRDLETIETAIMAAETGHLVLSTLHTLDAAETINRIIGVFPPYQHKQVRIQLGSILKGVISQRLVPRVDGAGRVPAVEVLINTARVREYIEDKDKTRKIRDAIGQGYTTYGMQTFDQSLMSLYKDKLISLEEALRQASNPDDLALRVRGISSTSDLKWDEFDKDEDPPKS
ncbi:MAG: twitching motility protein, twitching motility protein PilT [Deltaproteobacteria bacterium CSP1-8]|nr:MAG: twitching motility protein, twitching motility protein PilT [Deltaproteobacteria bacterium CSP1-8]